MCLRCLLHHILSLTAYTFRENQDFVFIIFVQFMMSSNSRMHFGLQIVFVCLYITSYHYHHCANLSEDIELIKCLSDIFCRVCEWDKAYSLSYPLCNIWGCVFAVYPFPLWWLRGYILCLIIIIKSEVWTITHCLGLGHETMVCAVCLAIFLFLSGSARGSASQTASGRHHRGGNRQHPMFLPDLMHLGDLGGDRPLTQTLSGPQGE